MNGREFLTAYTHCEVVFVLFAADRTDQADCLVEILAQHTDIPIAGLRSFRVVLIMGCSAGKSLHQEIGKRMRTAEFIELFQSFHSAAYSPCSLVLSSADHKTVSDCRNHQLRVIDRYFADCKDLA